MGVIANDIPFDQDRCDLYDPAGKDVVVEWFNQFGFTGIEENLAEAKKKFSKIWDVKGLSLSGKEFRIEVEIKKDWGTKWKDVPFRYSTMDIPYRKRDKAKEHATHHIVVGADLRRLFVVERSVVLDSPVTYKKVRNRGWQEEPFFNVPLPSPKSAFYFKNETGKWEPYKGTY